MVILKKNPHLLLFLFLVNFKLNQFYNYFQNFKFLPNTLVKIIFQKIIIIEI